MHEEVLEALRAANQGHAMAYGADLSWIGPLQQHAYFHVWNAEQPVVRWMTSFDTKPSDIDEFLSVMQRLESTG